MVAAPKLGLPVVEKVGSPNVKNFLDGNLVLAQYGDYVAFKGFIDGDHGRKALLFEKRIFPKDLKELGYVNLEELITAVNGMESLVDVGLLLKAKRNGDIHQIIILEQPTSRSFEVSLCDGHLTAELYPDGTHRITVFDESDQEIAQGSIQEGNLNKYVEGVSFDDVYKFLEYMTGLKVNLVIGLLDAERVAVEM